MFSLIDIYKEALSFDKVIAQDIARMINDEEYYRKVSRNPRINSRTKRDFVMNNIHWTSTGVYPLWSIFHDYLKDR